MVDPEWCAAHGLTGPVAAQVVGCSSQLGAPRNWNLVVMVPRAFGVSPEAFSRSSAGWNIFLGATDSYHCESGCPSHGYLHPRECVMSKINRSIIGSDHSRDRRGKAKPVFGGFVRLTLLIAVCCGAAGIGSAAAAAHPSATTAPSLIVAATTEGAPPLCTTCWS